jgi:site-specific DNA-methyltransferase (adenine-specific)
MESFPFHLNTVVCGNTLELLRMLPDNSIDSVVTDPPAGISFMGKEWDTFAKGNRGTACRKTGSGNDWASPGFAKDVHWGKNRKARDQFVAWLTNVMFETLRVLKPGGHMFVWALPRTSHWTAWAIEEAGFEIRDCVYHIFGSGFPKSMDIGKAIDKAKGLQRDKVKATGGLNNNRNLNDDGWSKIGDDNAVMDSPIPVSLEAQQWDGWGTALKPAVECWWLCRKPLSEKTVAANVLKWGTGGLNIDMCRVGVNTITTCGGDKFKGEGIYNKYATCVENSHEGRFPANLIHDGSDEVLTELGAPARFFYTAKASTSERNYGLPDGETNIHPTVKPISLMKYLITLITPPDGIVLDPFAGSGSTLVAAIQQGFPCLGFDDDEKYISIAVNRIAQAEADYAGLSLDEWKELQGILND